VDILAFLLVAALIFSGGIVFGLAARDSGGIPDHLAVRDATVCADMEALARVQQLNTTFMAARGAMWEEAARHQRATTQ
jgi:hypothetical protein